MSLIQSDKESENMDSRGPGPSRDKPKGSLMSGNLVENYFKTTHGMYDLGKQMAGTIPNLRSENKVKKNDGNNDQDTKKNEICAKRQVMVDSLDLANKSLNKSHVPTMPDNLVTKSSSDGQGSKTLSPAGQETTSGAHLNKGHRIHRRLVSPGIFSHNIYSQVDSMFNTTHTMGMPPNTCQRDIGYLSRKAETNSSVKHSEEDEDLEPCEKVYYFYSSDPETTSLQEETDSGMKCSSGETEADIHHIGSADSCADKGVPKSILRNKDGDQASIPHRHGHVHFTRSAKDSLNN